MKIEKFVVGKWMNGKWINGKWISVKCTNDFDKFMQEIVEEELPFRFTNCTKEDIKAFSELCGQESLGLDDCEYYSFEYGFDEVDEVYIYHEMHCYLLSHYIELMKSEYSRTSAMDEQIKNLKG